MARTISTLKNTSLASRLVRKLKALPELEDVLTDSETSYALLGANPGHWQRSAGAWSWDLWTNSTGDWRPLSIGGSYPASEMVKTKAKLYASRHSFTGDVTTGIEE